MAVSFHLDAAAEVELPLCCDPDTQAANPVPALARYLSDGDASGLVVPEGATLLRLRPLSASELVQVDAEAGAVPALGRLLEGQVAKAEHAARTAAWKAGEAALDAVEREALKAWRDAGMPADHDGARVAGRLGLESHHAAERGRAEAVDALSPTERAAFDAFGAWSGRRAAAMVRRGWLGVSNWPDVQASDLVRTLELVRPATLREAMRGEIARHVARLSELGHLGKASSGSRSREPIPRLSTPGTASPASSAGTERPGAIAGSAPLGAG